LKLLLVYLKGICYNTSIKSYDKESSRWKIFRERMVGENSYDEIYEVHFRAVELNSVGSNVSSTLRIASGLMAIWVVPRILLRPYFREEVFLFYCKV